ncbi:hypothetical protein WA158_005380 [Blastocystis sp. Blastoise]
MMMKQKTEMVSCQQSIAVVKNMIRTSISEICYLRNIFDGECFRKKNYAGMMINALHPLDKKESGESEVHSNEAWNLTRWLEEGVFEALEKKYLRGMIFAIYDLPIEDENTSLLEAYYYKITYPSDGNVSLEYTSSHSGNTYNPRENDDNNIYTTDSIRNQAVIMIRTLISLCSTLDPLPVQRYVTMKLYYYDDVTPPEYQPTFFTDANGEQFRGKMNISAEDMEMDIGKIKTPYHSISMCIKTKDNLQAQSEVIQETKVDSSQSESKIQPPPSPVYSIHINPNDHLYNNCVSVILTNDAPYVSATSLDRLLHEGPKTCRQLLQRLEKDKIVDRYDPKHYGRQVLRNEYTSQYLRELKTIMNENNDNSHENEATNKEVILPTAVSSSQQYYQKVEGSVQRKKNEQMRLNYGTPSSEIPASQNSVQILMNNNKQRIITPPNMKRDASQFTKCSAAKRPIEQINVNKRKRTY